MIFLCNHKYDMTLLTTSEFVLYKRKYLDCVSFYSGPGPTEHLSET